MGGRSVQADHARRAVLAVTYETWILQLKLYVMLNGLMSWDDATQFLSMFDLRKIWNDHDATVKFYDRYTRI